MSDEKRNCDRYTSNSLDQLVSYDVFRFHVLPFLDNKSLSSLKCTSKTFCDRIRKDLLVDRFLDTHNIPLNSVMLSEPSNLQFLIVFPSSVKECVFVLGRKEHLLKWIKKHFLDELNVEGFRNQEQACIMDFHNFILAYKSSVGVNRFTYCLRYVAYPYVNIEPACQGCFPMAGCVFRSDEPTIICRGHLLFINHLKKYRILEQNELHNQTHLWFKA